jgi:hypothetical protein
VPSETHQVGRDRFATGLQDSKPNSLLKHSLRRSRSHFRQSAHLAPTTSEFRRGTSANPVRSANESAIFGILGRSSRNSRVCALTFTCLILTDDARQAKGTSRGEAVVNARSTHAWAHDVTVCGVAIADQVSRRLRART